MIYIKLDDEMQLTITVDEPIYRGDNLSNKVVYLIPTVVHEMDMTDSTLFLSYISPDGIVDTCVLTRMEDPYNDTYLQYMIPITCKMTVCTGDICTWITAYSGPPLNPKIAKSSECILCVRDSKNLDDRLCDEQLSAIYALREHAAAMDGIVKDIQAELDKKQI